jgi:hypothetical protein
MLALPAVMILVDWVVCMPLHKAAALYENASSLSLICQHLNWDQDFFFIQAKKFKTCSCMYKMFAQQKLKAVFSFSSCIGLQIWSLVMNFQIFCFMNSILTYFASMV